MCDLEMKLGKTKWLEGKEVIRSDEKRVGGAEKENHSSGKNVGKGRDAPQTSPFSPTASEAGQ